MEKEVIDLTKRPPRSANIIIDGFPILARTIDKCKAELWGNPGDYIFNCPVAKKLFDFKGIIASDFRAYVEQGHTDSEIAQWVRENGLPRSEEEIAQWAKQVISHIPQNDWFDGECQRLGLDPKTTTHFNMLDADDKDTFGK